jgi:hypothetical protein
MKPLRFIHIARTGGQSISIVAHLQANQYWGMLDLDYGRQNLQHSLLSYIHTSTLHTDEMKNKYDWFMVVRNPYQRILSICNSMGSYIDINTYLCKRLAMVERGEKYVVDGKQYNLPYFTPQYQYIEPQYNIIVLRYENIEEEFNTLMNQYGYNITLNLNVNVSKKISKLTELSIDTIEYINKVYKKDFELFGYEMCHEVFPN